MRSSIVSALTGALSSLELHSWPPCRILPLLGQLPPEVPGGAAEVGADAAPRQGVDRPELRARAGPAAGRDPPRRRARERHGRHGRPPRRRSCAYLFLFVCFMAGIASDDADLCVNAGRDRRGPRVAGLADARAQRAPEPPHRGAPPRQA